ncbi:MAG: membrane-bound lytic murein transglycosylase MltF, partial [Gammaproteobacteria bacterium]
MVQDAHVFQGCFNEVVMKSAIRITGLLVLFTVLQACTQPSQIDLLKKEGRLHWVTLNSPTTYFESRDGVPEGLEYELAQRFAAALGVKLNVIVAESAEELFQLVDNNFAHFAGAGLTRQAAELRGKGYRFGPEYTQVQPTLVYRSGSERPVKPGDLSNTVVWINMHTPHFALIREALASVEGLTLAPVEMDDTELLEALNRGDTQRVIVDSSLFEVKQALYPRARYGFHITPPMSVSWVFPAQTGDELLRAAERFFTQLEQSGELIQITERYFGHLKQLNYVGARTFLRHIEKRLPRYEPLLKEAAGATGLDWRLLAAIGYQESHWRPYAVSPTGVKGFMMLTLPTARDLGIKNRLNPAQSIWGGARYFRSLKSRIPERIPDPDRTWFALAAYNVGLGHLEDARKITQMQGGDPDKWVDVKERLPLLQQKKWYKKTRHGYARGWEPVHYVQNIRRYYDVLTWMT